MNFSAVVALVLAALDLILLAKPELLEAIVRRAPTWEQMLAQRQRTDYFSYTTRARDFAASKFAAAGRFMREGPSRANPIFRPMEDE